jgi:hypothetical protein
MTMLGTRDAAQMAEERLDERQSEGCEQEN